MFGKSKATATAPKKSAAKKVKGRDNNKRLAALEAKEAASKATNADRVVTTGEAIVREKPTASLSQDYPLEYDLGRRAKGAAIARNQAPFGPGEQLDAWLEGYDA